MAAEGPGRYDPVVDETGWISRWADVPEPSSGEPYTIAVPPPNVTGSLHMGHALNMTTQDVLIRRARMQGRRTRWICGTDHAGIATQAVVEKRLAAEGVSRRELGREEFVRRVWEWREESGSAIIGQATRLGAQLDYGRERFTMDADYAAAVTKVFVHLYEKGLITRGQYLVNWDPGLGSAISDLEVETREVTDSLVSIAYPLSDGSGEVVVATVRPETMLGDTAVAVNPDDERYGHLIGKTLTLPLVGREIPIIGDEHVDPAFGTGCLKVTPAHDPNDFEIGRRHGLEAIGVIGEDDRMTLAAGEPYAGMRVSEAAARIREDLAAAGCIRGEEAYLHAVPFSQRSGRRVEPLISLQWFCDMSTLAEPAAQVVRDGRVRFHPENWSRVYLRWLDEIRPWCVSRQLWWGHQLPVWYRGTEVHVGETAPEGDGWTRDEDVLDTWFSSALWPFATLGWPDQTPDLATHYPTQVLSTARDIIFLWVARMVMMGMEFLGTPPFADVVIHSVIQAPDGRRMSKSLGTGVDPLDLIGEHGADATRFGLLLMSSQQDVRFSEEKIRQGRQLVTKLWNATSLVLVRGGSLKDGVPPYTEWTLADRWIAGRVAKAIDESVIVLDRFEFSAYADLVYHVIFDDYCDWYLEALKVGQATPSVAAIVLEQLLALAHPVIPFSTEACWERIPGATGLITEHAAPAGPGAWKVEDVHSFAYAKEIVTAVRAWRSGEGVPSKESLVATLEGQTFGTGGPMLSAALAGIEWGDPTGGVIIPLSSGRLVVARALGATDPAAERAKLQSAIESLDGERARAQRQLDNEKFVSRAPAELVQAERDKIARFTSEIDALRARLTGP